METFMNILAAAYCIVLLGRALRAACTVVTNIIASPGGAGLRRSIPAPAIRRNRNRKAMMLIKSKISVIVILLALCQTVSAQEALEPVDDAGVLISGILGGGKKGVEAARLTTDTEQALTVEVDYKGYEGKYSLKGFILNKLKKPIEGITCEPLVLNKPDGTAELKFVFSGEGDYTTTMLETSFVSFVFSKTDGVLSGLDLGGQDLLAETFLYKLNKTWRVGGNESMVISVKLTPFKSAASIQP